MRILDLCAAQGGATAGYKRAGHHVTAVDTNHRHAKYSPADEYVVADAYEYLAENFHKFDFVHISPPCQYYTRGNAGFVTSWPRSIPPAREAVKATGLPYIIENVKDAVWDMVDPIPLCGCMFDMNTVDTDGVTIWLQRLRYFESNLPLKAPRPCDHSHHEWVAGAYGGARRDKYEAKYVRKGGYVPPDKSVVMALLGIEHQMTWQGLFESVPPRYTEYLIQQAEQYL